MWQLFFECPKCHENFQISGYLNWIFLRAPFHMFHYRYTKCPHCEKRSWMKWLMITR